MSLSIGEDVRARRWEWGGEDAALRAASFQGGPVCGMLVAIKNEFETSRVASARPLWSALRGRTPGYA